MNIRIILDELKHPFCEASPDFFNWEHEFMLYHGLEALMPYTHTTVHAKYWNRWDPVDVGRCVRILDKAGYKDAIALEYRGWPVGRRRGREAADEARDGGVGRCQPQRHSVTETHKELNLAPLGCTGRRGSSRRCQIRSPCVSVSSCLCD